MSQADKIFKDLFKEIIEEGELRPETRMFWKDGTPAYYKSVIGKQLVFQPKDGIPLATSKFVPKKSAIVEMLWIWIQRSNVVQDLRDMGSKVWDEWELPHGTIGKAYGYQLENKHFLIDTSTISDKSVQVLNMPFDNALDLQTCHPKAYPLNQVEYIVQQLIDNPYSRHLITMLWNVEDYKDMSLPPCVYKTQWFVNKGKLELIVGQRSADAYLGLFYNVFQYSVLHHIIAELTGYPVGRMIFEIGDCHLYDRHINSALEYIANPEFDAPELVLTDIKNITDINYLEHIDLPNYSLGVGNAGKIANEVAITKKELDRLNKSLSK